MDKTIFIITLFALSLAACALPATATSASEPTSAPVDINMPVPESTATEMVVEGKIPATSFESQTYINQTVGFALDYPAQWTVKETLNGERGLQSALLSSPEIADLETLPKGATRVAISIYQWDPKNDLAAFVQTRKTAWDASGFTILEEEPLTLDLGLVAVRFTVQTSEGNTVSFLLAAIGDQYVSISGEGDLVLVKEIMLRLRPAAAQ